MKKTVPVIALILCLAACREPKMKLRASDVSTETQAATVKSKDTLKVDSANLKIKN